MTPSDLATAEGSANDGRPAWLDADRYPFESRWADLPAGRLHYLDEGEGRPVVLLHGNPTWSFLYRRLVAELSADYRCLAPDLLGFGLSEKPPTFSHRPAAHARVLRRFLDSLDLDGAVVAGHDWGGPLGFDYATRRPDRVAGFVTMNTWAWPRDRLRDRVVARTVAGRPGRALVGRYNAFARVALAPAMVRHGRSARSVYRQYAAPLADPVARRGTWTLAGAVVDSRAWLERLWDRRAALAGTPVALLWGRRDPMHASLIRRWRAAFPDASSVVYDDVGHFVPEEAEPRLAAAFRQFLNRV
ncbi:MULTISPECIES: alpha/beta fold hydrolase [Halorussus]|uniref:alpha/beta fold hydrolase n=1 Tax=Halorussus TaxID=1070314 RepID=UPI00209DB801|nr:alpha/beta fold hydrolase [Halorussus vallis]USZ74350.1 alpha/beta fold hydrolase [Halorussus vallis]